MARQERPVQICADTALAMEGKKKGGERKGKWAERRGKDEKGRDIVFEAYKETYGDWEGAVFYRVCPYKYFEEDLPNGSRLISKTIDKAKNLDKAVGLEDAINLVIAPEKSVLGKLYLVDEFYRNQLPNEKLILDPNKEELCGFYDVSSFN